MHSERPKRRVTLKDIAKAVGITHAAVSQALRNHPRISAATRSRVEEVARELGYEPNAMAVGLAHYKHDSTVKPFQSTLAWFNFWERPAALRQIPSLDDYWRGALEAAAPRGYNVEEFVCGKDITPNRLKRILVARGIKGILLPPQRPSIPKVDFDFDWSEFAVVRLGPTIVFPAAHMVTQSHASDAMEAVQKILEKGYRRIGHLTSRTLYLRIDFAAGFLKAREFLPKKDQIPLLILDDWPKPTREVLESIDQWIKKNRPEVIQTTEGNTKTLLRAIGYKVPEEIALVSTSVGSSEADAGMFENSEEVGKAAVKFLVGLIERREFGIPEIQQQLLIRGRWQEGATLPSRR